MRSFLSVILRDQTGTTMIEFSIVMVLFFLLTFGITEFGYALYQYNSATKAAQIGARLAAVSDPLWTALKDVADPGIPGDPWTTDYDVTCTGADLSGSSVHCTGTSDGTNVNTTYNTQTTLQRLVFGRGDTTCGTVGTDGDPGMCDIFDRLTPENVLVTYQNTDLGFAGRPSGPVPTITVTLTGLTYQFFGLAGFMGFDEITMPDFKVTMTGEDLSAAAVP